MYDSMWRTTSSARMQPLPDYATLTPKQRTSSSDRHSQTSWIPMPSRIPSISKGLMEWSVCAILNFVMDLLLHPARRCIFLSRKLARMLPFRLLNSHRSQTLPLLTAQFDFVRNLSAATSRLLEYSATSLPFFLMGKRIPFLAGV